MYDDDQLGQKIPAEEDGLDLEEDILPKIEEEEPEEEGSFEEDSGY